MSKDLKEDIRSHQLLGQCGKSMLECAKANWEVPDDPADLNRLILHAVTELTRSKNDSTPSPSTTKKGFKLKNKKIEKKSRVLH